MKGIDKINVEVVIKILTDFIRYEIEKVGFKNAVLGLSGGIDSATVAYLCQRALGKDRVTGVMMPYKTSSSESKSDAQLVADELGIMNETYDITPMVDPYIDVAGEDISNVRKGNIMARERMIILYDRAVEHNALVVGTSNKTEFLLGYTTLYGDSACALLPIGDLYKTQVRLIAKELGVPDKIITKAPSADLWKGQTDEEELGFSYEDVDNLLYYMVDHRYPVSELEKLGYDKKFINKVFKLVQNSQFKRKLPVIAKVSTRTIDHDFRYPRDWGV